MEDYIVLFGCLAFQHTCLLEIDSAAIDCLFQSSLERIDAVLVRWLAQPHNNHQYWRGYFFEALAH
jgi:hypothetical protein